MDSKGQDEVALHRWAVIAEAAGARLTGAERGAVVRQIAARDHQHPDGSRRRYSRGTIDRWIRGWRAGGLEALRPAERSDTGTVRAHPELFAEAAALRMELPGRSAAQIASILYHRHGIAVAERTIRAQLRRAGLHREALAAEPRAFGRYEAARPNERWITDVLVGPWVPFPKRDGSVRARLFLIVDDHSRLLADGRFFAHENARACQDLLRRAVTECSITLTGHEGPVYGLCTFMLSDQVLLASAGADSTVRIWEPASGSELAVLGGFGGPIYGLCAFTIGGRTLIACARDDGAVLIWDPITKELADTYTAHEDWANGVCALTVNGRVLLASGGADETVRIWDVGTRSPTVLHGHEDSVRGVCALTIEGRTLLASAGLDCTVRVWDPATSDCLLTIPVHHRALAVSWAADSLIVTLTAGLLLIEVSRVS
jgi:WD40 repeat protein